METILAHTSLQYTEEKTTIHIREKERERQREREEGREGESDLWIKVRPLVPITTAAGFILSDSLQIAFPASPSTTQANVFTYYHINYSKSIDYKARNAQVIKVWLTTKFYLVRISFIT